MNRPLLSRILLTSLLTLVLATPAAWAEENGAIIDPHGGCARAHGENGAILDPDGGYVNGQNENGAIIDPDGDRVRAQNENGAIIDPNGGCRSGS